MLAKILENAPHTNVYDEPPEERKESIPKQRESSMAKLPPIPSKDSAIDPEPQIPQISKKEESHRLNLSFDYEANVLSNLAGFGNILNYPIQKRPSKKHLSNPPKKGSVQKSPKLAFSDALICHVAHREKSGISDELPTRMSSEPIEGEPKCLEAKPILSPSIPISNMSFKPISKPILDPDDPKCALPSESYDDPVIDSRDSLRHLRHGTHQGPKSDQEEQQQRLEHVSTIESQEWLDEAEASKEVVKMPTRVRRISCQVMGIYGKICYDPSLGMNIVPHFHVQNSLKDHLIQSQKRLRLLNGQILNYLGVLRGIPMVIGDLKISLDFHIFDLPALSFHLIFIGRPIMQNLENALEKEKLGHRIGEEYLPILSSQSLNMGIESKPVLDPRGELMSISLTTMTHPSLKEDLGCHEKERAHPLLDDGRFHQ